MNNLHVLRCPSGIYSFVGSVPISLLYKMPDGSIPSEEDLKKLADSNFPAMEAKFLGIIGRYFSTEEEAVAFAHNQGFIPKVDNKEVQP